MKINFGSILEEESKKDGQEAAPVEEFRELPIEKPAPLPIPTDAEGGVARFNEFKAKIEEMKEKADAHEVTDDASNEEAVLLKNQAGQLYRVIEKMRKEVKAPYLEITKAIDSKAKEILGAIEEINKRLKGKIEPYMIEQQRKKEEEERRAREVAEAEARAKAEAKAKAKYETEKAQREKEAAERMAAMEAEEAEKERQRLAEEEAAAKQRADEEAKQAAETAAAQVEVIMEAPAEVKTVTDAGTADIKKEWDFRIIDLRLMPDQFFENRKKQLEKEAGVWIRAQIKAGITEIPGVETFQKNTLKTRAK